MASRTGPRSGGDPKRTGGVVTYVTERFGFIELTNKNIPIPKVYFDFKSFQGAHGNNLSQIFPKGAHVTLTFVANDGDHKVKHRAVNVVKSERPGSRPQADNQASRQQNWGGTAPQPQMRQQRGQCHPEQSQHFNRQDSSEKGGNPRFYNQASAAPQPQRRQNQGRGHSKQSQHPNRQNQSGRGGNPGSYGHGQASVYPHEPDTGSTYPHHQHFSQPPPTQSTPVGQVVKQALATGFMKLAEKLSQQSLDNAPSEQAAAAPQKPPGKHGKSKKNKPPDGNPQTRAFSDRNDVGEFKTPQPCTEDSAQRAETSHYTYSAPDVLVQQVQPGTKTDQKSDAAKQARPVKDKMFKGPEAKAFQNLLGNELITALRTKLTSLKAKSLNSVLLLRVAVGKKPTIRIFSNNESSNHTLEETKNMELEDLQRLLRHKDVVKSPTPLHYGVKKTLHSIRAIEQNGKLTGLTVFCQLHEDHDGLGLEVIERKGLTVVVGDIRTCPLKQVYNYVRSKSKEMAKTKDVLVLDVDGQLSGCDESPHPSLGDVTRLSCSSSAELPGKIAESIEHLHECAIAIGVDSAEAVQALQKMASKGTQVLAEISPEMKSFFSD